MENTVAPFFKDSQGYVSNIRVRHLIITSSPEDIVILPRAILDSEEQPYGTLEPKDQLPCSKDRDPLHPTKPTTILTLSREHLPDPPVKSTHAIPLPGPTGGMDTGPSKPSPTEPETDMEVNKVMDLNEDQGRDQGITENITDIPGLIPVKVDEPREEDFPTASAAQASGSTPASQGLGRDIGVPGEGSAATIAVIPHNTGEIFGHRQRIIILR